MPPKSKAKAKGAESKDTSGNQKISAFFKPEKRKSSHPGDDDPLTSPPPAKRATDSGAAGESLPGSKCDTPPTPPTPRLEEGGDGAGSSLSPEQKERIATNKLEAESKRLAASVGAESLGPSWVKALLSEFKKPYIKELMAFVDSERKKHKVYPPAKDVFSFTLSCPIQEVKVVILGQDPYHGPNQAHGMCFSVRVGVTVPPSLRNMYKELQNSMADFKIPDHGYLMGWAQQGVLLLNACLTVRHKEPNSHAGKGWENLTDAVIHWINSNLSGVVFILWGAYAQKKGAFINNKKHCVLKSPHPSPFSASRGFFGCNHFVKANDYLEVKEKKPIDWSHLPKSVEATGD